MDNYIVWIYDRDPDDSDSVSGILESVEQETRRPFNSLGKLRSMLGAPAATKLRTTGLDATPDTQPGPPLVPASTTQRTDH